MKIKQIVALAVLCVGFVAFTGCKKEEGPMGPQGPAGNANVKSLNFTINAGDWEGNAFRYEAAKDCNILTADIVENGAVMCYLYSGGIYTPLPFSIKPEASYTTHLGFEYSYSTIAVFFQDDDGWTPNPGMRKFKVVAIESRALEANPNLDLTNYEAVDQTFRLAE